VPSALSLLAVGCGDDASSATSIDGAWARTSPMNAEAGAVYFTVSADEAVSITGVSVDSSVADRAELHETVMADMDEADDMEGMDDSADEGDEGHDHGAMMMQEVASIDVEAGGEVALAPGGLHVMLLDLAEPLELGDTIEVTLVMADGESMTIDVEVMDEAP
jgi:copper(I)-binding protein